MSSNIEDNNNQILTSGESSANEDSDSSSIIPNLGTSFAGNRNQFNNNNLAKGDQKQATLLNYFLSNNNRDQFNNDNLAKGNQRQATPLNYFLSNNNRDQFNNNNLAKRN